MKQSGNRGGNIKDRINKTRTIRGNSRLKKTSEHPVSAEAFSSHLLEESPNPIIVVNPDSSLKYVNPAFEKLTGFSSKEVIGKKVPWPWWAPETPEQVKTSVAEWASQGLRGFPTPFKKKDGELFWVELSQTPVRRGNKLQYLVRIWIDITERKKAQDSIESLSRFPDENPYPVMRVAGDGALMFANDSSKPLLVLWSCQPGTAVPSEYRRVVAETLKSGKTRKVEVSCAGNVYLLNFVPIVKKGYVNIYAVDIIRLKQAEEKIKESEERYRGLYESTKDGIIRTDMSGRLVGFNEAYADMLGYPREKIFELTHQQITPPEWSDMEAEIVRNQIIARGYSDEYEKEYIKKDGTVFPISLRAWLIKDKSGVPTGMWGIVRDISERKKAEQLIRLKTEELERSNAELEQFAYVASHDLQEPLRMISSYVQLLAKRYGGKFDSNADEFIGYAVDGATRMQNLIRDLLAYSRVGRRGKAFKDVNLGSSLNQALENLDLIIRENNAVVTHDKLPAVYGDKDQLTQVFQNLIGNAIKFRGKKPPRVHISAIVKGDECICSVKDNGIGISPEFYGKVFQLFQRLHGKEEYPGTGIGLAICKKIVERHGGRIWVESKPKAGSTFFFSIPVFKKG